MIRELAATFTLSAPGGWLGETSYGQQRYPDANTVSSGYAWLLVPLVSHQPAVFQVGYAFSAQNSTQSRFVLADTAQAFPPADPRFSLAGQYVPYYTPMRLVSHAAIASLVLRSRTGTTFTAGGSYSFFARDDAPVFMRAGAPPTVVRASYRRSSEPWNAHVRLQGLVNRDLALGLTAEYNRTAFYRAGSVRVELVYRFGNAAVRRVDRF
jgi:hypothetical protein